MTDQTHDPDAVYYQEHKDDPAEWDEVTPPAGPKRRLQAMVSIRFTEEEEQQLRAAAEHVEESLSTFIRKAALMRLQPTIIVTMSDSVTVATASEHWRSVGNAEPQSSGSLLPTG